MGKGGSKQTTTQENRIPEWVSQAGQSNYQFAQQVANGYKPVLQQAPAGFTQDQLAAQEMIRNLAKPDASAPSAQTQTIQDRLTDFTYTPQTYQAAKMTDSPQWSSLMSMLQSSGPAAPTAALVAGGGGASAQQVGEIDDIKAREAAAAAITRGDIRDLSTQMTPEALKEYLAAFDPSYDQAVMDVATNDLDRARQITQQQNASAAAQAGAFGGSRHGLVEAETNRGFADAVARQSAQLRLAGMDRALGSFQGDQARKLQADTLNQGQDWNVANANAGFTQQANLTNAANDLEAARANQATELSRQSTNAQLGTQASIASAQMAQQAALANAAAQNQLNQLAYQSALQRQLAGMGYAFEGLQGDTAAENRAREYGAQAGNRAQEYTGQLWSDLLPKYADLDQQVYGRNLTGIGLLAQSGAQQQAYNQAVQDTDYANQLAEQQAPMARLGILQSALGNTPYNTSSTSTTEYQRSLLDSILGLGGFAIQAAGAFGPTAKSDERLKSDIRPIKGPLEKVRQLEGVSYRWRDSGAKDLGLVAQDVQRAMPDAVQMQDGAMHYSMPAVLGLLTSAVKELDRRTRR